MNKDVGKFMNEENTHQTRRCFHPGVSPRDRRRAFVDRVCMSTIDDSANDVASRFAESIEIVYVDDASFGLDESVLQVDLGWCGYEPWSLSPGLAAPRVSLFANQSCQSIASQFSTVDPMAAFRSRSAFLDPAPGRSP